MTPDNKAKYQRKRRKQIREGHLLSNENKKLGTNYFPKKNYKLDRRTKINKKSKKQNRDTMTKKKSTENPGSTLKDKVNFPNGWKLEITYGFKKDKNSFGNVRRYDGDSRKSVLYDDQNKIISSVIEENPYYINKY